MAKDQDWRLRLDLAQATDLEALLADVQDAHDGAGKGVPALGEDVVLTHDGNTLFAYAMTPESLHGARERIATTLDRAGLKGAMRISHWDASTLHWQQTDPPLSEHELRQEQAEIEETRRREGTVTRTVVCTIGRLIRKSFERQMVSFAQGDGLRCEVVEHPHLFSTQVAFELTGAPAHVEEFATYMREQAQTTTRVDLGSVPFGLP
jgi:hypothetical protein